MPRQLRWDDVLALGYAAEQLFVAGQLLTSDVVPVEQAVHAACERHIGRLLGMKQLLPSSLVRQLEVCFDECPARGSLSREQAQELGRRTLKILDELRRVLNQVAEQEDRSVFFDAA
jgi:hypothetical protein